MPPIPMVLIGAGQRGLEAYASFAQRRPEELRIVAVAEPDDQRRQRAAALHDIPEKRCFRSWQDLLDAPPLGEAALVCTDDTLHAAAAIGALEVGYNVLLETPIALNPIDCLHMLDAAQRSGRLLMVAHVLRYTAFYRALHDLVRSGRLGQIIQYRQHYAMAFWHSAHQFVRRPQQFSTMMASLGAHEFDLLNWILRDPVQTLSSVGSLRHYQIGEAPVANVPLRCVDHCPIEHECPFSAVGIYLEKRFPEMPTKGWLYTTPGNGDESPEALVRAVEQGPYGRCVYHVGSETVDQQAVLAQTASGIAATLSISGHGMTETRTITIDGSHASLVGMFGGLESRVTLHEHATGKANNINFRLSPNGHGGDHGVMGALVKALNGAAPTLTAIQDVVDAQLLAFAAEESRTTQRSIHFPTYRESLRQKA